MANPASKPGSPAPYDLPPALIIGSVSRWGTAALAVVAVALLTLAWSGWRANGKTDNGWPHWEWR